MDEQDEILNDFLVECSEGLGKLDQDFVVLEKETTNTALIGSIFRTIHTIKGTCGFLGLPKLENVAHGAENVLSKMRDGKMAVTPESITVLLEAVDNIKEIMGHIGQKRKEPEKNYDFIRQKLDALLNGNTPLPTAVSPAEVADKTVSASPEVRAGEPVAVSPPVPQFKPDLPREEPVAPASEKGHSVVESSIRVNIDILDKLMNLVGELVLARNQLVQRVRERDDTIYAGSAQRLNLVTTELQDAVMKTRMQPIKNVWDKFPRVVRDLAKSQGKEVDLVMEGADTELDRTLLEAIKDPLTHIVRNTVDHGIESSEVRKERGKPAKGTLHLKAYHGGGQIIVEIRDDGGGINVEKVKKKAVEKGLITQEKGDSLSEREALDLIFLPGLSTAEKVTNVSGRGVGMDVVKTNIEKIGGTLEISSQSGKGMTLGITIPLTLAIIPALMITSKGESFAIPQSSLIELVMVDETVGQKIEMIHNREFLRLRGSLLSLVRLDRLFKLKGEKEFSVIGSGLSENVTNIVVLGNEECRFGLIVDEVNDSQEIVVKPLSNYLKSLHVFAGATILGNGRVSLILDAAGISQEGIKQQHSSPQAEVVSKEEISNLDPERERQSLLTFTFNGEDRFAMPLPVVTRLEEFDLSRVEKMAGGEVIQYRGTLLHLVRLEQSFGRVNSIKSSEKLSVIVFSEEKRSIGLVVGGILDIIEEEVVIYPPTSDLTGIIGSVVVGGKTTELLDVFQILDKLHPEWFKDHLKNRENMEYSILHVDDSLFFRRMVKPHLEMWGYRVAWAANPVEALNFMETNKIDLIITDIEMPEMTGFELAGRVTGNPKLRDIPIVALSALNSESDFEKGRTSGFSDFLIKYDREALLATLQRILAGRVVHA
ncbi:MAG: chemotaxis protein CheW [Nitrospirae bacterium]|nr:chemotaxis protein CheW [Nitrospirota bacterium]MBI3594033.1 chemotaxis protein CheW [Nitrospirota bacterium]